jgi:hypothetical protein
VRESTASTSSPSTRARSADSRATAARGAKPTRHIAFHQGSERFLNQIRGSAGISGSC